MGGSILYGLVLKLYEGWRESFLCRALLALWQAVAGSRVYRGVRSLLEMLFLGSSRFVQGMEGLIVLITRILSPLTGVVHKVLRGSLITSLLFSRRWPLLVVIGAMFMLVPILPPRLTLFLLAGAVLFGLLYALYEQPRFVYTPLSLDRTLLLLAVIFTIATLTSVNPGLSLVTYVAFLAALCAAYTTAYGIRSAGDLERVLTGLAVGLFAVSAFGLYQYLFMDIRDTAWIDAAMNQNIDKRVYSFLGNPNVLACFLIMAVPPVSGLVFHGRSMRLRLFAALTVALSLLILLLTFSRGGWLGFALALLVMARLYPRLLLAAPLMLLPALALFYEQVVTRIASFSLMDSSISYRMYIWGSVTEMIRDYGWSGMGLGTHVFHQMYFFYHGSVAVISFHAHNFFLQMTLELGVFGMAAMLLFFLHVLFLSFRLTAAQGATLPGYIAVSCCAGFVGVLGYGVADHIWGSTILYFVFWMMAGLFMAAYRQLGK